MFLVVSRSDVQFGFEHSFFGVPDQARKLKKLRARKIGCLKGNLSTSELHAFFKVKWPYFGNINNFRHISLTCNSP